MIGDDLHFDVMRVGQELFNENGRISEGLESLGARTLKCDRKVGGRPDFANAPPSAPSRRFNKEGIAQLLGMMESVGQGFSRTSAPGHDRNLRLLREPLGGDLVADAAHSFTVWADERDTHLAAEVGEGGMLGHEAPSYPNRFRTRRAQSTGEVFIIHVAAAELLGLWVKHMRGAKVHGLVGFTNKHGIPVGISEQRDGAQCYPVLLSELAGRMNETHCGLAPVDDRHALEFVVHIISTRQLVTGKTRTQAATSSCDITFRSAFS